MKLGVGIIAFRRWNLLQGLLSSLEANTHLEDTDFHAFQDGAINEFSGRAAAKPEEIDQAVETFLSSRLPNKTVHRQEANIGVGINQFKAYEFMTAHYEQVVILEEDIVLSPHYLRLMRILLKQIEYRHDIFSASLGFHKLTPNISEDLAKARFGRIHWWGEGFHSEQWRVIRPVFMEYYKLIKDIDYQLRPHNQIRLLFQKYNWIGTASSQDGGRDFALHVNKLRSIVTLVNRGIYTGVEGEHSTKAFYEVNHFGEQEPFIFDSDARLDSFELISS